jgi:hypothetical protein
MRLAAALVFSIMANLASGFRPASIAQGVRQAGAVRPTQASLYSQFVSGARTALGAGPLCPLLPEVDAELAESTATFAMG